MANLFFSPYNSIWLNTRKTKRAFCVFLWAALFGGCSSPFFTATPKRTGKKS
ncbi:hypothetical protein COCHEDRAFT_1020237, partial [Bipolaris maydis C5]